MSASGDIMTNIRKLTFAGVIAALYAALTIGLVFISFGPIQFRVAEALTVLPFFFPHTVWGLFIGVIISNIFSPYGLLDVLVGSSATLLAGLITMRIGLIDRDSLVMKILACLPPVIVNAIAIGAMLTWLYTGGDQMFAPFMFMSFFITFGLQVGFGQIVVLYALGLPLLIALPKLPFDRWGL